jgi:hypothetical protein
MAGNKAHEQQIAIIEGRVNTKNADKDFDPTADLRRSDRGEAPLPQDPAPKSASDPDNPDDHAPLRGMNQESQHHKRSGR